MTLDLQPVTKKKTLDLQPVAKPKTFAEQATGAIKAVGGGISDFFKSITKPVAESVVAPIQAVKTAKIASSATELQKKATEQMKGTDSLLKALKTANTEEEKQTIGKLLQDRVTGYLAESKPSLDTSVDLPYYGKIEAPKTVSEVAGRGIETAALGIGGAGKTVAVGGSKLAGRLLTGAGTKIGVAYGAGEALRENKPLAEVAGSALLGGATGAVADVALGQGGRVISKIGEKLKTANIKGNPITGLRDAITPLPEQIKTIAKDVKPAEWKKILMQGEKAVKESGVKTPYEMTGESAIKSKDLLQKRIAKVSGLVDKELEKNPAITKLKNLTVKNESIGGKIITSKPVKEALDHLQSFYKGAGDKVNAQNIKEYIQKAKDNGLSAKEVNNIARQYSADFKNKAFNKLGEPLTSVSAEKFRLVQSQLKEIARKGLGGEKAKALDAKISSMIKTRTQLTRGLGKNNERAGSFIKRLFSPSDAKTKELFATLKEETGVDLTKEATLSKFAMESLKDARASSLLEGNLPKTKQGVLDKIITSALEKVASKPTDKFTRMVERNVASKSTVNQLANKLGLIIEKTGKTISAVPGYAESIPNEKVSVLAKKLQEKMPIGMTIKDVSKEEMKRLIEIEKKKAGRSLNEINDAIGSQINEGNKALRKYRLGGFWEKDVNTGYKELGTLTTRLLKKLEGKTTVSKQFISDLTNNPDLKQTEKDLIRNALKGEEGKINVKDFASKIKAELLPLKLKTGRSAYEDVVLPETMRGKVANYDEHIWNSPIKTSAGSVHFGGEPNYFGHTRIEDMADNKTRRVIEVQSDLYQKGRLEKEAGDIFRQAKQENETFGMIGRRLGGGDEIKGGKIAMQKNAEEMAKLYQYSDPTAHFRMVREEVAQAAKDKKTKLQFPTGETAMRIEGLVDRKEWRIAKFDRKIEDYPKLSADKLKVGEEIGQTEGLSGLGNSWIITDVLGDGKFKAVEKSIYPKIRKIDGKIEGYDETTKDWYDLSRSRNALEFDISGKADTSNPIYKFYEKDLGKYLKSKYNAKEITDKQGVSWYEVDINPSESKKPVEAFGIATIPALSGLFNKKEEK